MAEKNVIFHIPIKINREDASASQIRPQRMMEAFRQLGYQVDVVEGYAAQRQKAIKNIKQKIRSGVKYEFLYSESSTMPTQLTEPHHLPTHPCLDFGFFAFCKRHGIPIGLFYRDIHWQFANRNEDWKQRVARFFYFYDLRQYRKLISVLFLPSREMLAQIPFNLRLPVVELPSGCELQPLEHCSSDMLNVFYVGGITGNYDMRKLVAAVSAVKGVHLTICCRQEDWVEARDMYEPLLSDNVTIVHESGEALKRYFSEADVFAIVFDTCDYMGFAVPFKLFETIGYGVPVMASSGTWVGNFVSRNGVGLACDNSIESLKEAFTRLIDHPELLTEMRSKMPSVAQENTWLARCRQVSSELCH